VDLPRLVNCDSVADERESASTKFLNQFENIRVRWDYYEQWTEDIISWAADYQRHLPQVESQDLLGADEDILVLLALRCLVISHDISVAHSHFPGGQMQNDYFNHGYWKAAEAELRPVSKYRGDGQTLLPSIELWQLPKDYKLPNDRKEHTNTLPFLLWKTFQTAQRLLLRDRPRDWPALFYTLCLLMLTYDTLDGAFSPGFVLYEPNREFRKALKSLIRVFLHHCGNLHPLNAELNIECYSLVVGGETLHVKHYTEMNSIWVEGRKSSQSPHAISRANQISRPRFRRG